MMVNPILCLYLMRGPAPDSQKWVIMASHTRVIGVRVFLFDKNVATIQWLVRFSVCNPLNNIFEVI